MALLLTLGTVVFLVLTLALIAVVPVVLHAVPLGPAGTVLAQVVRWVLLMALIVVGLAVLYRVAPDRNPPKFRWVSVGSVVAALLWLLGTVGFSLYINFFGTYNKTYGTLAGVIVLLLWLYLTSYIVLLGAEINAQAEYQTGCDSTIGAPRPMGQRHAVVADSMPGYPVGRQRAAAHTHRCGATSIRSSPARPRKQHESTYAPTVTVLDLEQLVHGSDGGR